MKHLLGGVKKGAFSQEEAEKRFETWKQGKEDAAQAIKSKLSDAKKDDSKKRLQAEAEANKAKAEIVAKKKAEIAAQAAAAKAEAAPAAEEVAPVAESAE